VVIGFNQTTYSANEDAGNVVVAVAVLSGTLGQDVNVSVSTANSGSAEGKRGYSGEIMVDIFWYANI